MTRGGGSKPVSEYRVVWQLTVKTFSGDQTKVRQRNDKLLNALVYMKQAWLSKSLATCEQQGRCHGWSVAG
eukprot:4426832-Pyramimonas_sp.AAC.1